MKILIHEEVVKQALSALVGWSIASGPSPDPETEQAITALPFAGLPGSAAD